MEQARRWVSWRLDRTKLTHLAQGLGPGHDDVGVETGLAADLEREIAERDSSGANHLYDDRLRQGHHHYIGQFEISGLRLGIGPRRKFAADIVAEQRPQGIAFGKRRQTRRGSLPAGQVR